MEGARGTGFDWSEQGNGGVHVQLVLLACGTAFNVLAHKLHETQPPEFSSDELTSLEIPRVASSFVVMTLGEDRTVEGISRWDIDTSPVCEDMIVKFPVEETQTEGCRDVLQGRL